MSRYGRSLLRAVDRIEEAKRSASPEALREAVSMAGNVLGALVRVGQEDRPTGEYTLASELLATKLQEL